MTAGPRAPSRPSVPLPAGACDTHTHVFGPYDRFPLRFPPKYAAPDAPVEAHAAMRRAVGLDRAVIVQPAPYAADSAAILDALAREPDALRGVATATAETPDEELARWRAAGILGLRFVEVTLPGGGGRYPGAAGFDDLAALAPRMRAIGLHAQIWADCARIAADAGMLCGLGVPVVIEHMGRFEVERGVADPSFRTLVGLVAEGRVWIKLAPCRTSTRFPDYEDARPFHDALVAANPDRLLWASDWPHVRMEDSTPDVGHLVDLFDRWTARDPVLRRKVFVDNPEALYGFGPRR